MRSRLLPLSIFALAFAVAFASLPSARAQQGPKTAVCEHLKSNNSDKRTELFSTFLNARLAEGRSNVVISEPGTLYPVICAW